jgi:hypothetical protein
MSSNCLPGFPVLSSEKGTHNIKSGVRIFVGLDRTKVRLRPMLLEWNQTDVVSPSVFLLCIKMDPSSTLISLYLRARNKQLEI